MQSTALKIALSMTLWWAHTGQAAPALPEQRVVFEVDTVAGHFTVVDQLREHMRCLYQGANASYRVGCISPLNPLALLEPKDRAVMAAFLLHASPRRILLIGQGTGVLANVFQSLVPLATIDVVEPVEALGFIGRKYFNQAYGQQVTYSPLPYRSFVEQALLQNTRYDLVVNIARDAQYIPLPLRPRAFVQQVMALLGSYGVYAAVLDQRSTLYDEETDTFLATSGPFYQLENREDHSRVVIAVAGGVPEDYTFIQKNAEFHAKAFYRDYGINVNTDLLSRMDRIDEQGQALAASPNQEIHSPALDQINQWPQLSDRDYWLFGFALMVGALALIVIQCTRLLRAR